MAENNFSLQKTLTMLLDEKKYHSLRDILSTMNPADIAAIFDDLDQACLPLLFRLLPKELAAETFVEMEPEAQELLIRGFSDSELKEVIDELYVDDAVDIVEEMPANVVQRILSQAEPDMRKQINEILRYPEDSAGSIMTTEYVSLRPNMTVEEAILRIRRTGIDKETIYTCYVTRGHKLIGLTSVKDLLLCEDDDATIESIMQEHVITVSTLDDKEQVAQMFSKYNFLALPVVDTEDRLVGIVTFDDAMDVMEDEATEDMEKMAAMLPSEHPYMRSTPIEIWKNRIPWLLLLMVSATLTGIVITRFENSLAALPCLTAFIPHAHGHRRQLRLAGLRLDHPRYQPERDRVLRPWPGRVEGDPRVRALRRVSGSGVLREDHRGRHAAAEERERHVSGRLRRLRHDGRDGVSGQDRRLDAAAAGQKARLRPGRHGLPDHHDDRGLFVPARLLRLRDRDPRHRVNSDKTRPGLLLMVGKEAETD